MEMTEAVEQREVQWRVVVEEESVKGYYLVLTRGRNQATAAIDWLAAPESRCTSRDRAST